MNYSDFGSTIDLGNLNIDFNYIEENKHIGDQQYFKTKINYKNKDKSIISFETKRNLILIPQNFTI